MGDMTLNIKILRSRFASSRSEIPLAGTESRRLNMLRTREGPSLWQCQLAPGSKPRRIVGWTQTALPHAWREPQIPRMPEMGTLYFMCQLAPRERLVRRGTESSGIAKGCMERTTPSTKAPEGDALATCQLAPGQNFVASMDRVIGLILCL